MCKIILVILNSVCFTFLPCDSSFFVCLFQGLHIKEFSIEKKAKKEGVV